MNRSLTWSNRLKVEIIDESDEEFEQNSKIKSFSWALKAASQLELVIKLHLENPEVYDGQQYVSVKA